MIAVIFIASLMLVGDPYIGIAAHSYTYDAPEYEGTNPLGMIGAEKQLYGGRVVVFAEHISSMPDYERGYGINMVGVKYYFNE